LWAIAIFVAAPALRPTFAAYALWGSLALIVAGLAGIGLVRLHELHYAVNEKRVRRLWRWVVVAIAISVVPLALPFAILAGLPVDLLLKPLAGPVGVLVDLLIIPFSLLVDFLVLLLKPIAGPVGEFLDALSQGIQRRRRVFDPVEPTLITTLVGMALAIVVVAVLLFAAYELARWLLTRPQDRQQLKTPSEGVIEHDIVVPDPAPPRPRSARSRRVAAHDAVTAYVNAVEDLAGDPRFARSLVETPAEHSLRVRAADMAGSADFSRLAADYQLARYAERPITPREDRRALSRLDRLRRLLRSS
jgi:hypothetical protein